MSRHAKRFIADEIQPQELTWPNANNREDNKFPAIKLSTNLGNFAIVGAHNFNSGHSVVDAIEYYSRGGLTPGYSGEYDTAVLLSYDRFGYNKYGNTPSWIDLRNEKAEFPYPGALVVRDTMDRLAGKHTYLNGWGATEEQVRKFYEDHPEQFAPQLAIFSTGVDNTLEVRTLDPNLDLRITTGRLAVYAAD